ncbi:MAG: DUF2461 domain-containing protein [Gammaproteobacteria bacterium]|nr:DUF2461 domain-containing protein [Gammaproteobacteria bacterium]
MNAAPLPPPFEGELFAFLRKLRQNNERDWFEAHKPLYETAVRIPALGFIEAMGPRLEAISPHFRAVAKKSGGSLMRVYRDTRFSKDKTPYKTNVGIQFRHEAGRDVHCPGFYLHLEPGRCFLGAGIWRPDAASLRRIRDFLADNPGGWRRALDDRRFATRFMLDGDSLQRAPRGYPADHPLIEDLKRKDFIAVADFSDAKALDRDFVDWVANTYATATPLMRYLCQALDVPF